MVQIFHAIQALLSTVLFSDIIFQLLNPIFVKNSYTSLLTFSLLKRIGPRIFVLKKYVKNENLNMYLSCKSFLKCPDSALSKTRFL